MVWEYEWTDGKPLPDGISIEKRDPDQPARVVLRVYENGKVYVYVENIKNVYIDIDRLVRWFGLSESEVVALYSYVRDYIGRVVIELEGSGTLIGTVKIPAYLRPIRIYGENISVTWDERTHEIAFTVDFGAVITVGRTSVRPLSSTARIYVDLEGLRNTVNNMTYMLLYIVMLVFAIAVIAKVIKTVKRKVVR